MARYSATTVVCLSILSFFAGRFLSQLPGLPDTGSGMTVVTPRGRSKMLLESDAGEVTLRGEEAAADASPSPSPAAEAATSPAPIPVVIGNFSSTEEALASTGFMKVKPPGDHGETGHSNYIVQPFQLLSWYPRAYLYPSFMDPARAQHIVEIAKKRLAPSGLAFKAGDNADNTRDVRTSQGTFIGRGEDPDGVLAWVEEKIAAITGVPPGHGEPFNVLRYEPSQHYDSHYDAFSEDEYGPQASQRIATVLLYLSDVEEGGETVFLLEGKDGLARLRTIDYKSCQDGIKVKPRMGDALLFWSSKVDGGLDRHALHGGCPVVKGEKWVATKWIRNKCFMGDCYN